MSHTRLLIATRNSGKMREYAGLLRDAPFQLVSLAELGITHEVDETGETFEENARLKASEYASLSGLLTLADDSGLEVDALGGEPGVLSARYGEKSPLTPHKSPLLDERGGQGVPPSTHMSDRDRVDLLLKNLEGVPWERRTARFRCVLAIWNPLSPPEPSAPSESSCSLPLFESPEGQEAPKSPPFVKGGWGDLPPTRSSAGGSGLTGQGSLTLLVGSVSGMIQYEPQGDEGFGYDPVFYLPSHGLTMAQLPLEEKNRISHRANAAGKAVKALTQAFSTQADS